MKKTTILIPIRVREKLRALKYPGEPYYSVIESLIDGGRKHGKN